VIAVASIPLVVFTILFKFVPDIGWAAAKKLEVDQTIPSSYEGWRTGL
jgi:hypothetical protein